ncbi:putative bifunctional diguanylate cyclase/phosphodiesterase [Bosea sp. R86505]|uniref:putative bifunctional diguanylate cyclase/phosphodiesterase n=1 Tax=Bosea sp. R86505 TaxID=3101710 RepID=UPI00366C50C3
MRASLYSDVHVVLTANSDILLADWRRESQRTILVAAIVGFLITAFAAALLVALRQHERIDAERLRSAKVLADAIDAMADGFVMWDRDDRLVTCNRRYRDLYLLSAQFMTAGATFEDIIRKGAQAGQYPQAGEDLEAEDLEAFVQECIVSHRKCPDSLERLLPDGRWVLITERRMADGGIVGIRTDITAIKQAHADLSAASARANEAVEEAQRQNAALVEQEARISFLAHHDDLTGLHNRLSFRTNMMAALARAAVEKRQIALLFLDLDRFKDVNDTLGHPVGDKLLRLVAQRLSDCVSSAEPIARLGGDEFAIISMTPAQPYGAEQLSARVIAAVREPYSIDGHNIAIAASVGIAVSDGTGTDADDLLKQADLALYRAKSAGGGSFCIFADEMGEGLIARLEMEGDLRQALADHRFELAYQPIFDLRSSQLSGFEALLRWYHPVRGLVSPADFIPLAEETRLIVGVGDWVIRQACTDALRLPGAPLIAVNISPVQLAFGDIVATVTAVLEETGLPAARLELEITETALFTNDSRNLEVLRLLRQLGVRVVLDDFGTGYSSLSHLRLCPLDKIKIDRSFVHDMTDRSDSAAIVAAIASLAAELGMRTTAEGIESLAQLEAVRTAGCTQAQGFFLGKPQPLLSAIHTAASAAVPLWKSTQRAGKVTAIS